ncbi:hypothetical protein ABZ924_31010 [Streptomyces sp. NPDC046876]|uniref:hypothetical protein n=1 Tax=Streptomyces sp. NPDC046876 TaxID=3155616 RepID=UPI0034067BBC
MSSRPPVEFPAHDRTAGSLCLGEGIATTGLLLTAATAMPSQGASASPVTTHFGHD